MQYTSSYQTPPLQLPVCKNPYLIIQNSVYNQRVRHRYRLCLCLHIPMSLSSTSLGLHDKYNSQCVFDRLAFLMILTNGIDTAASLATVPGILALHRVTTYPLGRSRYQARLVYTYEQWHWQCTYTLAPASARSNSSSIHFSIGVGLGPYVPDD